MANEKLGREILKLQLKQLANQKRNKKITIKKQPLWLFPIAIERSYGKKIKSILLEYIKITTNKIKPLLSMWNDLKKLEDGYQKDSHVGDMEEINKQFQEISNSYFGNDAERLKEILIAVAISTGMYNNKQWQKILKNSIGTEVFLQEVWAEPMIKEWIVNNVSLIKGLTDEYYKKINTTVFNAFQTNQTMSSLSNELTKINKTFYNGHTKIVEREGFKTKIKTQSRSDLIARDQIEKLNALYTRKRQQDIGVNFYIWRTALDRRVRGIPGGLYPSPDNSHWALEGKVCHWDNSSIYADSIEDAIAGRWKYRSSIGAVEAMPGWAINCRCYGEAVFTDLINEVNSEVAA